MSLMTGLASGLAVEAGAGTAVYTAYALWHPSHATLVHLGMAAVAAVLLTIVWHAGMYADRLILAQRREAQRRLRLQDPMFDGGYLVRDGELDKDTADAMEMRAGLVRHLDLDSGTAPSPVPLLSELCVMCGSADSEAAATGFCSACMQKLRREWQERVGEGTGE